MFDNKLFFQQNQRLLLQLANTEGGRFLLGVKEKYPIVRISPSGWCFLVDFYKNKLIFSSRFFTYEKVAKFLLPPLFKMNIMEREFKRIEERDRYFAFLHFANLELKNRKFPQIFLETDDYYAGSEDGDCRTGVKATWDAARDATDSTADPNAESGFIQAVKNAADSWEVSRSFMPYDTSGLPDTDLITAASLIQYMAILPGRYIHAVKGLQGATLEGTDIDDLEFTSFGNKGDDDQIHNWNWETITLNEAGRNNISKTGESYFVLIDGLDQSDTPPTAANQTYISLSESANDPYLSVTHEAAGPTGVKTIQDLAIASVKTWNGLATASVKTIDG